MKQLKQTVILVAACPTHKHLLSTCTKLIVGASCIGDKEEERERRDRSVSVATRKEGSGEAAKD